MAEQPWWQRLIGVIDREYDRRIRAASLVTEYGASHGGHGHGGQSHSHGDHHDTGHGSSEQIDDDGEVAAIVNLPKGTRISRPFAYG